MLNDIRYIKGKDIYKTKVCVNLIDVVMIFLLQFKIVHLVLFITYSKLNVKFQQLKK